MKQTPLAVAVLDLNSLRLESEGHDDRQDPHHLRSPSDWRFAAGAAGAGGRGGRRPLPPGVVLLGQEQTMGTEAVVCPLYCLQVDYVTCPSSGSEKLPARCNCCLAPKGCTLHLSDGRQQNCSS
ncbi:hypothetical protein BAE44_0024717 [Dichanthelium oligosanthes]|uniref:Uncharacterized protein n=1 Tax=Dichanthelium oligosanthes TaxID=888268 RepID=A0A1E5UNA0_9POAL|nr:hypothetical protein BAE44_0024717 [Dichanthelium oligosanthes]